MKWSSDASLCLTRRRFLKGVGAGVAAAATGSTVGATKQATPSLHEARYYEPLDNGRVRCTLCPWNCVVDKGRRGRCGVRENRGGRYYTLVYGRPCAMHNDPIEKKPFFHVYPGSKALSIATVGCNIVCKFCQNWDISQTDPDDITVAFRSPDDIVQLALRKKSQTVAYTYSEPTIFYEYMVDCARAVRDAGLGNVVVSNGFINKNALKELCSVITAMKIDLKAFNQRFYGQVCSGRLQPVLDTLKRLSDSEVWFEIVVLLVPTLNDDMDEIKRMAAWIVKELGPDVPLHFTRFHPSYKMRNLPPTPVKTITAAGQTARTEGCRYVYAGNVPGIRAESTYCPNCGECVLHRYGHATLSNKLADGKCYKCNTPIAGVWM